ncbi:MAG: sigma 54-interacting transcriptional regulator [Rhodothermales bacterium]
MKLAQTIAIARRLLAENRAADVARMLEPVMTSEATPGQAVVRALLARVALLDRSDPDTALSWLLAVDLPALERQAPGAAAEVRFWMAWSRLRQMPASPYCALRSVDEAAVAFRRAYRMPDYAWARLARAEAFDRLDEPALAADARREAVAIFQWMPDAQAARVAPASTDAPAWPSEAMRAVQARLDLLSSSRLALLFAGERGAGKMSLARSLHQRHDPGAPFISFRYDASSSAYADARLFGSERDAGAWTDAAGGTLYLHEIADLPAGARERLFVRLDAPDGSRPARVIAGTRRSLDELALGDYADILERLGPGAVEVPPLRMRREDIPILAHTFIAAFTPASAPAASVTDAAAEALALHHWPGNVRQLRNELERIVTLLHSEPAPVIDLADLSPDLRVHRPPADRLEEPVRQAAGSLGDLLAQTERRAIVSVLRQHGGHITSSAEALGLTRQGLYKKIKRLGIALDRLTLETTYPMN